MKYLIVNADDLGASPGITRGIIEAHTCGILTSASLMVDTPWSTEAAALARHVPQLSVGLHVDLPVGAGTGAGDSSGRAGKLAREGLRRQYAHFATLMGRPPTHLDSHHNVHREAGLLECFLELARDSGLPLRGHSPARYFTKFYGQWGGESHPEQVGVESLLRMMEREITEGITELSCHPGYVDARAPSVYAAEREVELRTLCDPRVRAALRVNGITLVSFHDFAHLAALRVTRRAP
jgi:predicted glycoside hydrolase/deacetylase ChbG (UPF0249 family)